MTRKNKTPSRLTLLILLGLGISVTPHQVQTRTSGVSRALSPVLSSYEVIRMEPGEIERQVRTTGELRFRFNETDFYFNLEPHDMRAPNYRAVATGSGGAKLMLPPHPVHTFKGVLAGREDIRGRFNLTDGGVEGVVYASEGWYYVEPLRNYLPDAPGGELVVYRHSHIRAGEGLNCRVSLPERLQHGVNRVTAQVETSSSTTPTKYEFEIATEADYEYVQTLGGAAEANREIEGILNLVDGVYQSELLLQLRISFQHAWTTENDPYTATSVYRLLDEFQVYWNANYAAVQNYDLAFIWTGADHDVPRGLANRAVVCSDRSRSYALSKYNHGGQGPLAKYSTVAHEIGHLFGASHPNEVLPVEQSPSLESCSTSIMWPGWIRGAGFTFCKLSREEISSYVSSNNGCLIPLPIAIQPPTELEITASSFSQASFSRIDLSWQDNSTNEMGFIVQRRRGGWGHWTEVERTAANTTTFSDIGLFPGTTYSYQVQAFNSGDHSAFSNEVEAETAAGPLSEADWEISTIAGTGEIDHNLVHFQDSRGSYSGDGGPAVEAHMDVPYGVAVDGAGNIFIADTWNQRIRRVDTKGIITTIAGTGEGTGEERYFRGGYGGDGGPAVEARLNHPNDLAMDRAGNLYIADYYNNRIRRVDAYGIITTVAGVGRKSNGVSYGGDGGSAVEARLYHPSGVAVDRAGNLYIADGGNRRIRRVDSSGIITTIAGIGLGRLSRRDGPANLAALDSYLHLALDGRGNLYIADTINQHIRRIDSRGIITTIAGTLNEIGYPQPDYNWDSGPALEVRLADPAGIAVDKFGKIYFADSANHRIRTLARPPRPPNAPSRLTATAASFFEINLSWQDNSDDEAGFMVHRRVAGPADWVEVGRTKANITTFSDTGLEPTTIYHYRVRAFKAEVTSDFSNEAQATTPKIYPPTLTRIAPARGPVGTLVALTGTHFLGATDVQFNEVSAAKFEVVSGMSIEAVVPAGATSGPVSVVTPGGITVSAAPFTVTTGIRSRLFIPIVLRAQGRTRGSLFTSELVLTNRGTTTASILYTYRAAFGGGSGTAVDYLSPGRQRIIPDAIAYLRSLGIPIGDGSAGGTLAVDFSNLSSPRDAAATVRVTTPVEEGRGRAGLAYLGLTSDGLLTGPAYISGLRQNKRDRSNLAVQNGGDASDGNLTLRVTVFSGDSASAGMSVFLPDKTLPPGGFYQYNRILKLADFDNGYVKVERVAGEAPFYAYGVINDNFNSDGSFVFPVTESSLEGTMGQTLPVIIETGNFRSELTITNFSASDNTVDFSFVADAVETGDDAANFSLTLKAGKQTILPDIVEELRQRQVAGIGGANQTFVGALFATAAEGNLSGIVIGARTGSPGKRGGQYSLFYNGVPYGSASIESAWIYGLQQNAENRSNLALVNTGEIDNSSSTFKITIYDGNGESQPRVRMVTLGPRHWTQENGILGKVSQGYVQVRKISGNNPFITYGVINDGGRPGERSGDGAFLPAQE